MNWYKKSQANLFVQPVLSILQQPPSDPAELSQRLGFSSPVPLPDEASQILAAIDHINNMMQLSPDQMNTVAMIREFLGQSNQDPVDQELNNAQIN